MYFEKCLNFDHFHLKILQIDPSHKRIIHAVKEEFS